MVAPLAATTGIFRKEPRRKYIFMVLSPAEVYFDGLVDIATKRGLKTVAVVNEDTLFSKAAAAGAVELAKKRSEEHTSELQSLAYLVCRLLLEKKKHN